MQPHAVDPSIVLFVLVVRTRRLEMVHLALKAGARVRLHVLFATHIWLGIIGVHDGIVRIVGVHVIRVRGVVLAVRIWVVLGALIRRIIVRRIRIVWVHSLGATHTFHTDFARKTIVIAIALGGIRARRQESERR